MFTHFRFTAAAGFVAWFVILLGCGKSSSSSTDNRLPQATGASQNLVKRQGGPLWNLESVGPVNNAWAQKSFDLPSHGELTLIGWAVDQQAKAPAGGVDIVIDGVPYAAKYGKSRPDVAVSFGVPAYSNSGYAFDLMAEHLPPGAHTLFVRVLANDGKSFWEAGPYTITLK